MRSKEEANDYRYFPDPDLPPLVVDSATMAGILRSLPELPAAKFTRYVEHHGLSPDDARTLVSDRALAEYFDLVGRAHSGRGSALAAGVPPAPSNSGRMIANWMLTE